MWECWRRRRANRPSCISLPRTGPTLASPTSSRPCSPIKPRSGSSGSRICSGGQSPRSKIHWEEGCWLLCDLIDSARTRARARRGRNFPDCCCNPYRVYKGLDFLMTGAERPMASNARAQEGVIRCDFSFELEERSRPSRDGDVPRANQPLPSHLWVPEHRRRSGLGPECGRLLDIGGHAAEVRASCVVLPSSPPKKANTGPTRVWIRSSPHRLVRTACAMSRASGARSTHSLTHTETMDEEARRLAEEDRGSIEHNSSHWPVRTVPRPWSPSLACQASAQTDFLF